MKKSDEKGKLMKKFNVVDAIVVLLILVIIAALGFKIVKLSKDTAEERKAEEIVDEYAEAPHLLYQVICIDVPEDVAKAFEAQMQLPLSDRQMMSNGKPVEGYITGCTIEPHDNDALYDVHFNLEAMLVGKDGIYSVGSQEVRIGKAHIVKSYNIETSGWVYSMETTGEVVGNE